MTASGAPYQPPAAVSVVVPTYNERDNVEPLARRIFAAVDPKLCELVLVDDDSPDGTADEAARLAERYPIRCLVRKNERGLATAVIHGLKNARQDLIVSMDADLSHPPEALPNLLRALEDDRIDMVIGSRFVKGGTVDLNWPWHRRLNSWGARMLAVPLTPVRDMMAGFFAIRRARCDFERLRPVGYKIALELIVRHKWRRVVETPISFSDRAAGQTKMNLAEQMRYLEHLRRLYAFKLFGCA